MNKMDEIILVVPKEKIFKEEVFQGVDVEDKDYYINQIANYFETMRRGDAETNYNYKQPIPYVLLRKGEEIFLYRRLSGGGETRLFDKLSLGVGGHMNTCEQISDFNDILNENVQRELSEELIIRSDKQEYNVIGILNDETNDVGKVHIAILYTLTLDDHAIVEVRETEQLQGEWFHKDVLKEKEIYDKLENWSKIALSYL